LPLDELSDAELAERCRAGQAAAWSTLVRRFQRLIYTVPRRAGLNDEQAADVFQTCFARLHEHLGRIDDLSRVRAWLVTTARRETLKLLEQARQMPRAEPAPGDDGEDGADPLEHLADPAPLAEQALSELQQQTRLREAVDRLDPRARQFVELLFLQEPALPYSEIAARLGIAEGSIGPTRARVLAKLRTLLEARR
jgi:RNA polymerase sigma factor (sigma-70 family)